MVKFREVCSKNIASCGSGFKIQGYHRKFRRNSDIFVEDPFSAIPKILEGKNYEKNPVYEGMTGHKGKIIPSQCHY